MALADSRNAIGALGEQLRTQLQTNTSIPRVDVGRVDSAYQLAGGPKFNLFLYQLTLDGQLRNHPLDEGQKTPIWMVVHYLLTAFDDQNDSDSSSAHEMLGEGILALQELNYQYPSSAALADNPEPLKITFDQAEPELISKIMQGSTDYYRLSAAFQVRPIMIAPGEPPSYAPLVRSVGPSANEGVVVLPNLGPRLSAVEPDSFEVGPSDEDPAKDGVTLTVRGQDLSSAIQWICLGDICYPVNAAPAGELRCFIPTTTELSPGSHPVTVAQELPGGRRIVSNALMAELLPTVNTVTLATTVSEDIPGQPYYALTLNGTCLGGPEDDIYINFWREGVVDLMLEADGQTEQTSLSVQVPVDAPLTAGHYRIILRVNGSQAPSSPEVEWT